MACNEAIEGSWKSGGDHGDWEYYGNFVRIEDQGGTDDVWDTDHLVALVFGGYGPEAAARRADRARLIRAAPELLAACESIIDEGIGKFLPDRFAAAVLALEVAVAKARGEADPA